MTGSLSTLVRSLLIVLFITMLVPSAALSQEQSMPGEAQSPESGENAADTPDQEAQDQEVRDQEPNDTSEAGQEQDTLFMPRAEEDAESEKNVEQAAYSKDEDRIYIVRKGDTLWDISNAFMKDPFLWPFIWKANPYIADADLIYPGNRIIIPSLAPIEQAMQMPRPRRRTPEQSVEPPPVTPPDEQALRTEPSGTQEEKQTPKLILPEQEPVPIMDKYSMLNAGFVSLEESRDRIVGSLEEKTIFGYDDIVYVQIRSKPDAAVGDKFLLYQPLERVRHPVTGRNYGRLIKVLGILELTQKGGGNTFKARITLSFDAVVKGSMLTPYQEPTLIYDTGENRAKDITGYILEVMDHRTINAQTDIVYLDKGAADGVEPGDRFFVYDRSRKRAFPRNVIGEAQVFLVKERTATAVVRKSTNPLGKGYVVESKK